MARARSCRDDHVERFDRLDALVAVDFELPGRAA
jgi:hypothetical protein